MAGHDPDAQAADWWIRTMSGLDPAEAAGRDAWLAADPAHAEAYARVRRGWDALGALADTPAIAALRAEAAAPAPPRHWWPAVAVAAAVALVAGGGGLWLRSAPGVEQAPVRLALSTRPGEQGQFALPDGSVVTLDTDSQVDVAFAGHRRDLALARGQAYFRVAHDRTRPFVVRAGEREVVAVGTEFDVAEENGRVTIALTRGRVRVEPAGARMAPAAAGDTAVLDVGETLVFDRIHHRTTISHDDQAAAIDWQTGELHFADTPLRDAVRRFNRYGGVQMRIGDAAVATMPVSGVFDARNAAAFARALPVLFPVEAVRRDGVIELRHRG